MLGPENLWPIPLSAQLSRTDIDVHIYMCLYQGDQIGRIFARWVIVYFGQFFTIAQVARIFGTHISTIKVKH
jgi:hypothetical protein